MKLIRLVEILLLALFCLSSCEKQKLYYWYDICMENCTDNPVIVWSNFNMKLTNIEVPPHKVVSLLSVLGNAPDLSYEFTIDKASSMSSRGGIMRIYHVGLDGKKGELIGEYFLKDFKIDRLEVKNPSNDPTSFYYNYIFKWNSVEDAQ